MADDLDKFVDDVVKSWIQENDDHLRSMYTAYLEGAENSECSFDEFAVYIYYEYNH